MRWEDERFVKVYTRDTANFLSLSLEAQGLWLCLLRKFDRAGFIDLGTCGKRGLAAVIGHASRWETIAPLVEELIAVGFLAFPDETRAFAPNFAKAQEAQQSAKARKAAQRERDRAAADAIGAGYLSDVGKDAMARVERSAPPVTPAVTSCHAESRDVTSCHAESQAVTPRLDQTRLDETRLEKTTASLSAGADVSADDQSLLVNILAEPTKPPPPAQATNAPDPRPTLGPAEKNAAAGSQSPSRPGPEDLQRLWNETAHPDLPRWRGNGKTRAAAARQRLAERDIEGPEGWREVIRRLSASAFCRGANNRGWRADPDFLLAPDTANRVLEGKYDDRGAGPPPPPPRACQVPGCSKSAGERCGLWDGRPACAEHAESWDRARVEAFAAKRSPAEEFKRWLAEQEPAK